MPSGFVGALPGTSPIFLDANVVKIRDGQVANRLTYAGIGVGRIRSVPVLCPRDPPNDLLHRCDRVTQRTISASGASSRTFPHRASRSEMLVSGHSRSRSHRSGPSSMDGEVETSSQRIRHHLPRPQAERRILLMKNARNTVIATLPTKGTLNGVCPAREATFKLRGHRLIQRFVWANVVG